MFPKRNCTLKKISGLVNPLLTSARGQCLTFVYCVERVKALVHIRAILRYLYIEMKAKQNLEKSLVRLESVLFMVSLQN